MLEPVASRFGRFGNPDHYAAGSRRRRERPPSRAPAPWRPLTAEFDHGRRRGQGEAARVAGRRRDARQVINDAWRRHANAAAPPAALDGGRGERLRRGCGGGEQVQAISRGVSASERLGLHAGGATHARGRGNSSATKQSRRVKTPSWRPPPPRRRCRLHRRLLPRLLPPPPPPPATGTAASPRHAGLRSRAWGGRGGGAGACVQRAGGRRPLTPPGHPTLILTCVPKRGPQHPRHNVQQCRLRGASAAGGGAVAGCGGVSGQQTRHAGARAGGCCTRTTSTPASLRGCCTRTHTHTHLRGVEHVHHHNRGHQAKGVPRKRAAGGRGRGRGGVGLGSARCAPLLLASSPTPSQPARQPPVRPAHSNGLACESRRYGCAGRRRTAGSVPQRCLG